MRYEQKRFSLFYLIIQGETPNFAALNQERLKSKMEKVQVFQDKRVRTHWDAEHEEWYFSVVDVVGALTDSVNPTDYLKKMRKRDTELATFLGTNCPQIEMLTGTGKRRKTLAADTKAVFRIIQSIPSPKAEPFKQ